MCVAMLACPKILCGDLVMQKQTLFPYKPRDSIINHFRMRSSINLPVSFQPKRRNLRRNTVPVIVCEILPTDMTILTCFLKYLKDPGIKMDSEQLVLINSC